MENTTGTNLFNTPTKIWDRETQQMMFEAALKTGNIERAQELFVDMACQFQDLQAVSAQSAAGSLASSQAPMALSVHAAVKTSSAQPVC